MGETIMKRSASEIIRNLEMRIAHLEKQARPTPAQYENQFQDADKLQNVDRGMAQSMSWSGDPSGDKINLSKKSFSASKLIPSQSTIKIGLALNLALSILHNQKGTPKAEDLDAIISGEGNIMDGHHRWAGTVLANGGEAKVIGYYAKIKGEDLLRVLNIATKGYNFSQKGNTGSGNINDLNYGKVKKALQDFAENGTDFGKFSISKDRVNKILSDKGNGSVEEGIEAIAENAQYVNKKFPSWAPKRVNMPVIEDANVKKLIDHLSKGHLDWKPPYTPNTRRNKKDDKVKYT
jgi:hypothetical protein